MSEIFCKIVKIHTLIQLRNSLQSLFLQCKEANQSICYTSMLASQKYCMLHVIFYKQ